MKKLSSKCTPIIFALISLMTLSCTKYQIPGREAPGPGEPADPEDELVSTCDPDTVYFSNDILPLVVSSCGMPGCHDAGSHRDGVILTDYASILRTGGIKPGDPNDSEFLETLSDNGEDRMPPAPYDPLNADQILMIRKWIAQGARDNACDSGCDLSTASFSGQIWPMMETYCTGCHEPGTALGGIVIAGYEDLVALARDGSLMGSIRFEPDYAAMPPAQQLSECNINLLQKWIDDEYPE